MTYPSEILTDREIHGIEAEAAISSDPKRKAILLEASRIAKTQKAGSIAKAFNTTGNGDRPDARATLANDTLTTEQFLALSPKQKQDFISRRAEAGRAKLQQHMLRQLHRD